MYWLKDDTKIASPALPFLVKGTNFDVTLTLVNDNPADGAEEVVVSGIADVTRQNLAVGTETITQWVQTDGAIGHFENADGDQVSIPSEYDPDPDCPLVEAGVLVVFDDLSLEYITYIESSTYVTLGSACASQDITGIYAVKFTSPNILLESSSGGAALAVFDRPVDTTTALYGEDFSLRLAFPVTANGSSVRVTLEAAAAYGLIAEHASIGERSGTTLSTVDVFNSSTFKELLFSAASGFSIGAGESIASDWLTFNIDSTKEYLIILDLVSDPDYQRLSKSTWATGLAEYYKSNTNSYNVQSPTGFTSAGAYHVVVTKIEVQGSQVPTLVHSVILSELQADSSAWQSITGVTVTETISGLAQLLHVFSFDNRKTWRVYSSGAWRLIAKEVSDIWYYNDSETTTPNWVAATVNSEEAALQEALSIAANQMDTASLEGLSITQWAESAGFAAGQDTVDFAIGLLADGTDIPEFNGYTISYDLGGTLKRVSLCVINSADAGIISAKKSTDATYLPINSFFDAACFLGEIAAETETDIDFRINAPETESDGRRIITMMLCYGDNAPLPDVFFNDDDSYYNDNSDVWVD